MDLIIDIGTIEVERAQLGRWRDGTLGEKWRRRFEAELPLFFDAAFRKFYENQGKRHPHFKGGFGFFETLAAIVLYHTTGYLPLTPTHNFQFPPRQEEIIEKVLPAAVLDVITDKQKKFGRTQAPDLLMYAPDLLKPDPDWFFCEVKGVGASGAKDTLGKKQEKKFKAIAETSGKPVRVLHFKWAPRRP